MSTKDSKSTKKPTEEALTTPVDAEQSAHQNSEEKLAKEPKENLETPENTEEKEHFAKAGKRSKKHIEAEKAEAARQARKVETKAAEEEAEKKPKGAIPITRPRLERRGKKYQAAHKLIDKSKVYTLKDAIELAIKTSPANFDATVEAHVRLNVDPRQADQNIRATIVLPNGSGKTVRVAVFAPLDEAKIAKSAGADLTEEEALIKDLEKGIINFDVLISTPKYMPKLGKYARLLGPKGLMPNPKAGTVTTNIKKAVKEAKAGKVEYRVDKQSIIHIGLGKVSFGADKLHENATAFFNSLKAQKPASIKGTFIRSTFITTTMGPSIAIENIYD